MSGASLAARAISDGREGAREVEAFQIGRPKRLAMGGEATCSPQRAVTAEEAF